MPDDDATPGGGVNLFQHGDADLEAPVEDDNALQSVRNLDGLGVNGMRFSKAHFAWAVDDFFGFVFAINHNLTRAAVGEYLLQRGTQRHSSTPHQLAKLVKEAVHLGSIPVSCCPSGCMAFTGGHSHTVSCPHCGSPRYRPASTVPKRVMPYWLITPWIRMMLLDEKLSGFIMESMHDARRSAAEPQKQYADHYDSDTYRGWWADGTITAAPLTIYIMLRLALDGFDPWRQTGFKSWIVTASVMTLPADMRSKNVSTLPIFITPGPNEPVDMDSFMALAMAELNSLAAGLDGLRVFGKDGTYNVKALVMYVCADAPGGDKVTHMTGHGGYCPDRLRPYHGVLLGTKYYFPPVDPTTGEELVSVSSSPLATRSSLTLHEQAASVEVMRTDSRPAAHVRRAVRLAGVSGWSPLLCPSPATRAAHPSLVYLWALGWTSAAPYDPMHVFLCNVAPALWRLVAGVLEADVATKKARTNTLEPH